MMRTGKMCIKTIANDPGAEDDSERQSGASPAYAQGKRARPRATGKGKTIREPFTGLSPRRQNSVAKTPTGDPPWQRGFPDYWTR